VTLQVFGPLDAATEAALRASIVRFGVIVPVVVDQQGRILDGHHRARIAGEFAVEYDQTIVQVADDDEAREYARTLNADRRQLTPEQRLPVVAHLRDEGHSLRAIAGAIGVSKSQVEQDVAQLSTTGHLRTPHRTTGLDGKSYPAHSQM
jgi:ParB family chromosome partitioning protein